ncbi:MAG: MFS transporter, partial [Anaerovoracaceae bacterium]
GLSMGPVLGGVLNENFGWKSIFLFTAVLSAVAFVSALRNIERDKPAKVKEHDYSGMLSYAFMVSASLFGLSNLNTWIGPAAIAIGCVMAVFFVKHELKLENPVMNIRLFKRDKAYTFSNITALLNYASTFALGYLLSIYLQVVLGYNSQIAGLVLVIQPVIMALISPIAGKKSDKINPFLLATIGMAIISVAIILFVFISENTGIELVLVAVVLAGIGYGIFSSPNTNAVMSRVKKEDYGVASSILATMRSIGMATAMAIITVVVSTTIGNVPLTEVPPAGIILTMKIAFGIFSAICIAGTFMSYIRK